MKTTTPPDSILTQEPASSEALFDRLALLEEENKNLQEENSQLHMYIRQLRLRQFGPKSEKLQSNQDFLPMLDLFDEAGMEETETETAESVDDTSVVEKKTHKKRGRRPLPDNLPKEQVIHDLAEDEKQCACGHILSKIGEETSRQLEYIPAHVKVLEHVRYKYACRAG